MVLPNHQTGEDSPEAGTLDGVVSCECGRDGHGTLDRDAGMFGECQRCEDAAIHIYGLPPDIRLAELKYCFHEMGDITDIQSSGDGHALVVQPSGSHSPASQPHKPVSPNTMKAPSTGGKLGWNFALLRLIRRCSTTSLEESQPGDIGRVKKHTAPIRPRR
ncbi:hypothetical protein B0H14DRAFT_2610598 [Mycena olivaceomarginata]|nr:hypothetical protein B0H14DRAFT_2610598 [Mycena olivaceomarginata]